MEPCVTESPLLVWPVVGGFLPAYQRRSLLIPCLKCGSVTSTLALTIHTPGKGGGGVWAVACCALIRPLPVWDGVELCGCFVVSVGCLVTKLMTRCHMP